MKALKPPAPLADHPDVLNVTLARCGMWRRRPYWAIIGLAAASCALLPADAVCSALGLKP